MGALRRYHEDNRPYFVTAVVKDRRSVFADHHAARLLRDVIVSCRNRYRFLVLSYIVMPDHFHAILVPKPGDTISAVMRYIKGTFARRYNAASDSGGAVWQPRFYDAAIRSERELMVRIRYVEENPVRAGLVKRPEQYPFSSAAQDWRSDLARYLGTDEGQAEGLAYRS